MGLRQLVILAIFFGAVPEALAADRQPGVFQARFLYRSSVLRRQV